MYANVYSKFNSMEYRAYFPRLHFTLNAVSFTLESDVNRLPFPRRNSWKIWHAFPPRKSFRVIQRNVNPRTDKS